MPSIKTLGAVARWGLHNIHGTWTQTPWIDMNIHACHEPTTWNNTCKPPIENLRGRSPQRIIHGTWTQTLHMHGKHTHTCTHTIIPPYVLGDSSHNEDIVCWICDWLHVPCYYYLQVFPHLATNMMGHAAWQNHKTRVENYIVFRETTFFFRGQHCHGPTLPWSAAHGLLCYVHMMMSSWGTLHAIINTHRAFLFEINTHGRFFCK